MSKAWVDMSEAEKTGVLEWVKATCLLFGTELSTAYRVAGEFAHGLETPRLWDQRGESK